MEMVRAQYLRLVRQNHPDQYQGNPGAQARHEEIMKEVTWAYREIIEGRARAKTVPPPRPPGPRPSRPAPNMKDLQCHAHGRWAVGFCTVCGTPLCSRCDEALTGYCSAHRPGAFWS
ncbi:J domain-containing protein [Sulfobacillus sp. DSM 109850]|uniref:J domain-containing protein n=2 Tax=Sulfobacillus harzensis TaxID=2729629 RepID=A0A7Y0Q316_9FIRM|nr:J domain-containing protein [Sulfobacillus harzensis]